VEAHRFNLAGAIASFAAAIALMVYGVWFYRKMKRAANHHMKKVFSLLVLSDTHSLVELPSTPTKPSNENTFFM